MRLTPHLSGSSSITKERRARSGDGRTSAEYGTGVTYFALTTEAELPSWYGSDEKRRSDQLVFDGTGVAAAREVTSSLL